MITTTPTHFSQITQVTCDCCGNDMPLNMGHLPDHLRFSGYHNGKLLDAIVCIKCMHEKLGFVKIQRKENTIGYC